MTDEQPPKRKHRKKPPPSKRLTDLQLITMSDIFGQGFAEWYRSTHDENGNMLPSAQILGLRPQQKESEETYE